MPAPKVHFVVSERFLGLTVIGVFLIGAGYVWHLRLLEEEGIRQQTEQRLKPPPYFVSRGATVVRSCRGCSQSGSLTPQSAWQIGPSQEIPANEVRWLLAVEDPPLPIQVGGVLMLPVYPAFTDDPAKGFDQTAVQLAVYQNLQRMYSFEIVQPPAPIPSPPPPLPPPSTPPAANLEERKDYLGEWRNVDAQTRGITRFTIVADDGRFVAHAWGRCFPDECDWGETDATTSETGLSTIWRLHGSKQTWALTFQPDGRIKLAQHIHSTDSVIERDDEAFFVRAGNTEGQQ
jgi:hypothetical protein